MKIGCRKIGGPSCPRWIIHNDQKPEQYWTGAEWAAEQGSAILYRDRNVAYPEAKRLQDMLLKHLPLRVYTSTIKIGVRSQKPLTLEQLKDYCHGAASFEFDYDLYGTGPVDESHVWATIQWNSLKKVK